MFLLIQSKVLEGLFCCLLLMLILPHDAFYFVSRYFLQCAIHSHWQLISETMIECLQNKFWDDFQQREFIICFVLFLPMLTPRAWPQQSKYTPFYVPFSSCEFSSQIYYKTICSYDFQGRGYFLSSSMLKDEEIFVEIPGMRQLPLKV